MRKAKKISMILIIVFAAFFVVGMLSPQTAAAQTDREKAIEEVREAIRALPAFDKLTAADRPAVEAARRLADRAMAQYNLTEYDLCTLSARLAAAESKVGAGGAGMALPATGGLALAIPLGLFALTTGAALSLSRRKKQ